MHRTISRLSVGPWPPSLATLLLAAGCGDVEVTAKDNDDKADKAPSASPPLPPRSTPRPARATGSSGSPPSGGTDGETEHDHLHRLQPLHRPGDGAQAARRRGRRHHARAGVAAGQRQPPLGHHRHRHQPQPSSAAVELKVYSLSGGATKTIDVRERTGQDDVRPVAWAFDPTRDDTLRVVDTKNRVWSLSVAGGKATAEPALPDGDWVFTNGFNPNTGEPYVESIDSDETKPAGNGEADTEPGHP